MATQATTASFEHEVVILRRGKGFVRSVLVMSLTYREA